jgi:hypothetical protein
MKNSIVLCSQLRLLDANDEIKETICDEQNLLTFGNMFNVFAELAAKRFTKNPKYCPLKN